MKKYIRSDRVGHNFGKGGPKYVIYVFDGDDNKWKTWGGWYRSLDEFDADAFLDIINHPNFPNPEYNYDRNYLDVKVIPNGEDISEYVESSTSIKCSTRDPYNVDSKYKLSQRSRNYLSKYIDLTQDVIDDIEQHAEEFDIKADISAYYKDIADFISDWVSIGYSTREAIKLFENNDDEFLELPSGEIIRFVM